MCEGAPGHPWQVPTSIVTSLQAIDHGESFGASGPGAENPLARLGPRKGEMRQRQLVSLVEAVVNATVSYGLAVLTQVVFPMFGLAASSRQNLAIGAIISVVSLLRGYAEPLRDRGIRGSDGAGDE